MTTQTLPPGAVQTSDASDNEVVREVRNLTKHFPVGSLFRPRYVHALNDASFTIACRQVVALVGESGSGKSTTARLIARLMPPTRGQILLHGQDVLKTEPRRASLAYRKAVQMIFQDPFGSLNPLKTIGYAIERPMVRHGSLKGSGINAVYELLETVGLTPPQDIANRHPYQLSGGQRQRVAIARALAVQPEIILADEPISMLDVSIRMGVLNLMGRLKDEQGIGFLYITHDLASARYIADRTIVMYAGHMVEGADSIEMMDQPAHPYTKLLISAVPDPQSQLSVSEGEVRGEIPSLIDPPPGCPFVTRCPYALDVCRTVMPGREYVSSDHWVRCHLYGPGEGQDGPKTPATAPNSPPAGAA
jgi:peptide/nickel transport system ATP-binding protein